MTTGGSDLPDAVQWHEGMFLAPQHFQQSDQRMESLVAYHRGLFTPFHWGVRTLVFDEVLLANGLCRVIQIEAVMPDGLVVAYDAEMDGDLEVDLNPFAEQGTGGPLIVHLAVPKARKQDQPVAGSLHRFRSVESPSVVDENTGEGGVAIPRLRPNPSLLVADSAPEKYTSLPIARVHVHADSFSRTAYVPPLLQVGDQPDFVDSVTNATRRVRERAVYLSENVRRSGLAGGGGDSRAAHQVEALTRGLPMTEAVLQNTRTHPFQLYVALCGFAGAMTGVRLGQIPPVFQAYDHNDILRSFQPVLAYIEETLAHVHKAYRSIPFLEVDGGYELDVPEGVESPLLIGVTSSGTSGEGGLDRWVKECQIASSNMVDTVRQRRVRGAARELVDSDSRLGVVADLRLTLFHLDVDEVYVSTGATVRILKASGGVDAPHPTGVLLFLPAAPE